MADTMHALTAATDLLQSAIKGTDKGTVAHAVSQALALIDGVHAALSAAQDAPAAEDAYEMGATGGPYSEAERLAFEAWMRGHCWALGATWGGTGYRSDAEQGGNVDPQAMRTRQLWAAWRDRAALAARASQPAPVPQDAQVGDVAASTQGHDGTSFLCRIWGEDIDHTLTAIVPDWDGVRRFCVENYTGSENHADYDGKLTLETLKENFDEHEAKGSAGAYVENWEIGGLSIERICDCTPARTQPATPAPVDAAATVPDLRERLAEAHDASLDTDHHACRAILMEIIRLLDTIPPAAPQAVPLTDHHKLDNDQQVFFYEQDFYVLSNFSAFNLKFNGLTFPTSEHAYHYEKFAYERVGESVNDAFQRRNLAMSIKEAPSAHEAFKLAERWKGYRRADWDAVKVDIMREILRAKASQHEYVRRKLLETGDRELIEDSWRDDYWGWGPNRDGQNMLGKLWMEVRAGLRGIPPASTTPKEQQ